MTDLLSSYIPMDRRQALARRATLADRSAGAALFADISGFTPLTELLAQRLGPQRGAEEVTRVLNAVYETLIAEVDAYGGSVVSFNGDAITCWFDGDDGRRATACALAMQAGQGQQGGALPVPFPAVPHEAEPGFAPLALPSGEAVTLAMKVAIASGPVRRFLLGDPARRLIDVLAGVTLDRLAAAEHLAAPGEVILDPVTLRNLGDLVQVITWRQGEEGADGSLAVPVGHPALPLNLSGGSGFGVVGGLAAPVAQAPWPALAPEMLPREQVRPWLLPAIYDRIELGQHEFVAQLRPAVALFLHFAGLDYDGDPAAGDRLNAYTRWVESVLDRYGGTLLDVTIGDKGSYLYAAFGAPVTHRDDATRAARAALELLHVPADLYDPGATAPFMREIRIGIASGPVYAGTYGGSTRRTYSVLGDAVNVAARLMELAETGEILVSGAVRQATSQGFAWDELPALPIRGKAESVSVFRLRSPREAPARYLPEPRYEFPLVGRAADLARIEEKLALAHAGLGQLVGITGEAGLGKSRLVAEVIRRAEAQGFQGYGGECQSYGTHTPYLVWSSIWRDLFDLAAAAGPEAQIRSLEDQLAEIDPALVPRLPLLGVVLGLPIPDNDLTQTFDAALRKASLEALLVDCLRARAQQEGGPALLLVLEDIHWIDPLSHDLLEAIGRAIAGLPVLILCAYRPPELDYLQTPRVTALPYFSELPLSDFTPEEAAQLIALKLAQIADDTAPPPAALVEQITARTEGNPLYIEELINYLHDRGLNPRDTADLERIALPASLHSLILDRVDQLSESQQVTLKVASIIGRLFLVAWLWGVYPTLGEPAQVKKDLEALHRLDLTPRDTPEPQLAYLFKHQATWEVAYESLTYATRAQFHEQLAHWLETTNSVQEPPIALLAYHYGRSANTAKQREYYRQAADAAAAVYANAAALDYYTRLLPLLLPPEQPAVLLALGEVAERVGQWDAAEGHYRQALAYAEQTADRAVQIQAQQALGILLRNRGNYAAALVWLDRTHRLFLEGESTAGTLAGLSRILVEIGELYRRQEDYTQARALLEQSLDLSRQLKDGDGIAMAFHSLGWIAYSQGDYASSRSLYNLALDLRRTLPNKQELARSLNSLGLTAVAQGDFTTARPCLEESLALRRGMGDKQGIARSLNSLGLLDFAQERYSEARRIFEEGLMLQRDMGDKQGISLVLANLGWSLYAQGEFDTAHDLLEEALALAEEIGSKWNTSLALCYLGWIEERQGQATQATQHLGASLTLADTHGIKHFFILCVIGLANVALQTGHLERAARLLGVAEDAVTTMDIPLGSVERGLYDQMREAVTLRLDPTRLAALLAAGRSLSREQVVAYARSSEDDHEP